MSKRKTVVILALLIVLMHWIGVPQDWKDWFYLIAGLFIALFAYLPDRVYCDECRKLITDQGHRDHMAKAQEAPAASSPPDPVLEVKPLDTANHPAT